MNSIIIARLLGPFLLASAASVLLNRRSAQRVSANVEQNPAHTYLAGIISFLGGLAIVVFHNVFVAGWQGLITLVGWVSLVLGAARMLFPERMAEADRRMIQRDAGLVITTIVTVVIGVILTINGFGAAR